MQIKRMTNNVVTTIGAVIILASVEALAFIPPQSAVNQCLGAVEQKYAIQPQHLDLRAVRGQPIGDREAVIYLHTAATPDPAQRRVRMYCTIDQRGKVTRLRTNPRVLDAFK